MTRTCALRRLDRDDRGATIIEFAIVLPVMLITILGLSDIAYREYVTSILEGAMQKAARDSTLQGGAQQTVQLDQTVMKVVQTVAKNATFVSSRLSYSNFSNIKPERFTDSNGNGIRDPGECYDDVNGNGQWDSDPGIAGQGGANDAVLYQMTITYPRIFPMAKLMGWGSTQQISSTTLLKNQPYASQSVPTVVTLCN